MRENLLMKLAFLILFVNHFSGAYLIWTFSKQKPNPKKTLDFQKTVLSLYLKSLVPKIDKYQHLPTTKEQENYMRTMNYMATRGFLI